MTRGYRVVVRNIAAWTVGLSITRIEFNHVVLRCRSAEDCDHTSVIRNIGLNNERLYAET